MTPKEYMSQAYRLDQQIDSKLEQVDSLHHLAAKATSLITGMPGSPNRDRSSMEDIVIKMIDLEREINQDIDELIDLKKHMVWMVRQVSDTEHRMILEKRYMCFEPWEQIALDMGFSIHHLYKVHSEALKEISNWIPKD